MIIRPFDNRDGFTKFHNYTLDHIMPSLPPNAWKVLCLIIRKTTGWRKDEENLSYSEIKLGTGIKSDATLSAALKELLALQYIFVGTGGPWDANTYGLNTEFEIHPSTTENEVEPTTEIEVTSTTENEVEPTTEIEVYKRKGSKDTSLTEKRTKEKTNQPVSRSLIGDERLVGLPSAETAQEINQTQGEEQQAQQQPEATAQATAVAPPSSEAPPPDEVARSFALLTDPDVGLSIRKALEYSQTCDFVWLMHQVATWWDDYRAGNVAGAGALSNRIAEMWQPNAPSAAFLRSELYWRHYPLVPEEASEWAAWQRDACLPEHFIGRAERPPWLDGLPDEVRVLLEALPAPEVPL